MADGAAYEWVYRASLAELWADIPQGLVSNPDPPGGDGTIGYIARVLYGDGLYIAKIRGLGNNGVVIIPYNSQGVYVTWTGSIEVLTMRDDFCEWVEVDTAVVVQNPGTVIGK